SEYQVAFIEEKVQLIKSSESYKAGKIRGTAAYFINALKQDYKPNKSSKVLLYEIQNQKDIKVKNEKAQEEVLQRKIRKEKKQRIEGYLVKLSEDEKSLLFS